MELKREYNTRSSKVIADFSKFAMKAKPKLKSSKKKEAVEATSDSIKTEVDNSNNTKSVVKREHIKIEPDETSPSKKTRNHLTPPENWEKVLKNLREMRKNLDAPVDMMGCQKCHDENAPPNVGRYQKLLSLMLSSQTKDQVTYAAMNRLVEHGCTIENILATPDEKLGELIKPVGFWKVGRFIITFSSTTPLIYVVHYFFIQVRILFLFWFNSRYRLTQFPAVLRHSFLLLSYLDSFWGAVFAPCLISSCAVHLNLSSFPEKGCLYQKDVGDITKGL